MADNVLYSEQFVQSGEKRLRCGYTTGTCAALAAKAAATLLLTGTAPEAVSLLTPKGWTVEVQPSFCKTAGEAATAGIVKDSGDDPDITNGMTVVAAVKRVPSAFETLVLIRGGEGVGTVTKPGLDQPVGEAAINHVPREMITAAVLEVCEDFEYDPARTGALEVTVSIPGGEDIARKTFNPKLGIEGGLSVIGTSGIVEPMSEQALMATIAVELRQVHALGNTAVILTPGNYGMDFLKEEDLADLGVPVVKMSNYVGWSLEQAVKLGFQTVLLVGHIGKLIKLAGGQMNTHSKMGDRRMELMAEHAARCGADDTLQQDIMAAATTEAGLDLLAEQNLLEPVMASLMKDIEKHIEPYTAGSVSTGVILFSSNRGTLGASKPAENMIKEWREPPHGRT